MTQTLALVFFALGVAGAQMSPQVAAAADVMQAEDAYRLAKLNRDIPALERILASGFNETNQNGNSRDKTQTIELWKGFSIHSLTSNGQVRFDGNTAMVTGTQIEDGTERMLFSRVWVKNGGAWQLLSSMQYRNPNPFRAAGPAMTGVEGEVMQAEEAYRLAKLNRDTATLERILASGFNETNQNGNSRDKTQTVELWKGFAVSSLTTDSYNVSLAGDTAMVIGTQTEGGSERMLFSRVWVKRDGAWKLFSSMQFRDPRLEGR